MIQNLSHSTKDFQNSSTTMKEKKIIYEKLERNFKQVITAYEF